MAQEGLVTMSKQEINRCELLKQIEDKLLTQVAAAQIMNVSDRQIRRLLRAYRQRGPDGIVHGLRGRPSNRTLDSVLRQQVVNIIKTNYADFGPTLATEKLAERHNIILSHETVRQIMCVHNIWKTKKRKVNYHQRRERRQCYGEMEQFDGCVHDWFEGRGPKCTLLASRDDANNAVVARFYRHEGTDTVMGFWR